MSATVDTSTVDRNLAALARGFPREARRSAFPRIGMILVGGAASRAPVLTGFLANDSAFSRVEGDAVVFGFNADYAAAVHERHETHAQFLAKEIAENAERVFVAEMTRAHAAMQSRMVGPTGGTQ